MLDKRYSCKCFGHPKRIHSTLHCKYLKKIMHERGKKLTSRGLYE